MNPFEQLLRYGQQAPKSTFIDTVANPESYRTVSRGVQEVLQRNMPSSYGGLGIQNAPTNLIGEVNDIANMPSGRAKEAARNSLQRKFQMASQLDSPTSLRGAGQARSGALRAPNLPGNPRQYDFLNPRGIRAPSGPYTPDLNATFQGPGLPPSKLTKPPVIPTGGRPVPFITPTGGSNPIVGSIPRGGTRLQKGGVNPAAIVSRSAPKTVIQQGGKTVLRQGAGRLLGPLSNTALGGYEVYNAAQQGRDPYRQLAKTVTEMTAGGLAVGGGMLLGVPTTGPVGAVASLGLYTPASVGAGVAFDELFPEQVKGSDTVYGNKTPGTFKPANKGVEFVPGQDFVGPVPQPRTGKGGFVVVPKAEGGGIRWDPNFDQSSIYTQTSLPPSESLPPSPEQVIEPTPLEQQLTQYEQGRRAATTQAEMNQVRDQGLAIHKAHNPQLYSSFRAPMASDRTFNPLMANTFPDMYPQSREAFIKEGGVQMPQSMNNIDARTEIIEGNRLEGEQRAARLTEELKAQEFMQRFLKMKGEEEKK